MNIKLAEQRERDQSPFTIEKRNRIQNQTLEAKAKRAEVLRQKRMQMYGKKDSSPPKVFNNFGFENTDDVEVSSGEEDFERKNDAIYKTTAEFKKASVIYTEEVVVMQQQKVIVESESDSLPRLGRQELRSGAPPMSMTSSNEERLNKINNHGAMIEERERAKKQKEEEERQEIEMMNHMRKQNEMKVIAKMILVDMI